jgi:hypothetical protein
MMVMMQVETRSQTLKARRYRVTRQKRFEYAAILDEIPLIDPKNWKAHNETPEVKRYLEFIKEHPDAFFEDDIVYELGEAFRESLLKSDKSKWKRKALEMGYIE